MTTLNALIAIMSSMLAAAIISVGIPKQKISYYNLSSLAEKVTKIERVPVSKCVVCDVIE